LDLTNTVGKVSFTEPAQNISTCVILDFSIPTLDIFFSQVITVDINALQACPGKFYPVILLVTANSENSGNV
jgi:hypothetical protein